MNVTIDEALTEVARRSFYEDCKLTPVMHGGDITSVIVEDDWDVGPIDGLYWDYRDGIVDSDGKRFDVDGVEVSRCMEPCEIFATAEHIRYHMSEAVEALEAGKAVSFSYQSVEVAHCELCYNWDDCDRDHLVGWSLVARIWG